MRKILIPCDGSDNALRAVRYAASLAKELSDVQLELLNVQDPLPQKVHAALSEQVIAHWQAGEADLILRPARQILDAEEVDREWTDAAACVCYRRTKNLGAVQLLLGHTKLESAVRYLGSEVDDALDIAEQTEV